MCTGHLDVTGTLTGEMKALVVRVMLHAVTSVHRCFGLFGEAPCTVHNALRITFFLFQHCKLEQPLLGAEQRESAKDSVNSEYLIAGVYSLHIAER